MVAGSWLPKITTVVGLVPLDAGVTAHDVSLVVSTSTPSTITQSGGETLQLLGTGFPASSSTEDVVEITLDDGTPCNLVSSTPTELTCQMGTINLSGALITEPNTEQMTLTISINGVSVSSSMIVGAPRL